jgi:hypothetical protein
MLVFDPTSVAHTMPAPSGGVWSVEDIARMQAELVETLVRRPAAVAPVAAEATSGAVAAAGQKTMVSGRYRSAGEVELELRVDVDGERPTRRMSGDFFRRTGGTTAYVGSFLVNAPAIAASGTEVVIEGEGVFSFPSGSPRIRVSIPRMPALAPPGAASVQFLTSSGVPGSTYSCQYESPFFRTVELEQDVVGDVQPFASFDVSRLQSPARPRVLTVPIAYGEAGIEMIDTGRGNSIPVALAGADRIWTNSELHHAMTEHFARWTSDPAWRVYLIAATIHERGSGLRGIMFDAEKRQACAVFHDVVGSGGSSNDVAIRAMLRTYVHELGHCFNLYHSHQKEFMDPPQPNRMDALSWMHYPDYYQGSGGSGAGAYWRAFPFQFDDDELVHLRHGFRNAVVPGGQPFGIGAADIDPEVFAEPVADESGLALELRAAPQFLLGTPVVVEIKLSLTDLRGRTVNAALHPNYGYVQIGIARLGGKTLVFRPMMTHCLEPDIVTLNQSRPSVYDSAYIGYGKDGFYFAAPGQYELRALYKAPDGSQVISNALRILIKAPLNREEGELSEMFLGESQGKLLYLLGSDSESLRSGRDAFELAIDKYPKHTLTAYARLIEGMNASRPFKRIEREYGTVGIRQPDLTRSETLLAGVVNAATGDQAAMAAEADTPLADVVPRLDNISLNMAMSRLAEVRKAAGKVEEAVHTMQQMLAFFTGLGVPKHVQEEIKGQIGRYLPDPGSDPTTTVSGTSEPPSGSATARDGRKAASRRGRGRTPSRSK